MVNFKIENSDTLGIAKPLVFVRYYRQRRAELSSDIVYFSPEEVSNLAGSGKEVILCVLNLEMIKSGLSIGVYLCALVSVNS